MAETNVIRTVKRQDASQVAALEENIRNVVESGEKVVILDMTDTVYISSATLRILLKTQKSLAPKGGKLILRHVSASVMEVLDLVGFTGILQIEEE